MEETPTYTLSKDLMAEVREAFALCDPKNTGMIRTEDLGAVMRALGFNHTEAELYKYVDELDEEDTGHIEFNVFVELMANTFQYVDQKKYLVKAFKMFDRDGKGFISYKELRNMFTDLGEKISDEEFDTVFREVDIDRDGIINLKDFLEAYRD